MFNLLSVSQVVKKGNQVLLQDDGAYLLKANSIPSRYYTNTANQILLGEHEGGVFTYKIKGIPDINTTRGEFDYKPTNTLNVNNNNNTQNMVKLEEKKET